MKSYVKLSSGLMMAGLGTAALERALAGGMAQTSMHLPTGMGWITGALAVAPLALIAAGILVYVGGVVLGLK